MSPQAVLCSFSLMGFEQSFSNLSDFCYNIFIPRFAKYEKFDDRLPVDSQMGRIYETVKTRIKIYNV